LPHDDRDRPNRRRLIGLYLLIWLWVWPTAAAAQIAMDAWTVEDGLPQSSVYDIRHTRDGYLWIATLGGLVRFDGVRLVTFDRATPGIGSLRVRALHEDSEGTLWAGTEDGVLIRYRNGQFRTYGASDGFIAEQVFSIDDGHDGALWVTSNGRITRFDGERFETFVPGELPQDVRPHPRPGGWQGIWWSQQADGVHCLAGGRVSLCLEASRLPPSPVINVSADNRGGFWIHTASTGVVHVRHGNVRHYTVADGLPPGPVEGVMFEDREHTLWLGMAVPAVVQRLRHGARETIAVQPLRFYEDRDGSLWIGTVASGLRRVRSQTVSMITDNQGLSSNNVYTLMTDREGNVWAGTLAGGLNRRAPNGTMRTFGTVDGLPSINIGAIFQDSSGRLIVGTRSGTVTIAEDRVARYSFPGDWLDGLVSAILEDDARTLWFGTSRGLVWQRGDRVGRHTVADGLPHDHVMALLQAANGDLWIGTHRGLARLRDGELTSFTEQNGFIGNQVRALVEQGGAIWVGTYDGGLYRVVEDRLTRFTTTEGLHDNGVFQLIDDGRGYLWAGSNRGISRLRVDELHAVAEGRARLLRPLVLAQPDGLSTSECNGGAQPSGFRMLDDTIWIPTQGGIAVVDTRRAHEAPAALSVHIEAVRINGRPVAIDSGIELGWDQDTLEFEYTAPSFVRPAQVRFRYRLAGLHDDWIEAGTRRTAAYHLVPPGRYTFQVMAAVGDSGWSEQGSGLAFVIHAPLWNRGWFRLSAAASMVGLTLLVALRRGARLTRERDRQISYARQLVEAQEQERRRISNDLHDSLGQTLFMIRQHARTLTATAQEGPGDARAGVVADLAARACHEMKEIAYALRPYQLDKIGLTGTLESMLHRVREAAGLEIVADLENIDGVLPPDAQIGVYRIVQEAVNNVVRHAAATEAVVRVRRVGSAVDIEIWDNGKGFAPIDRSRNGDSPSGLGLRTICERAHALNGAARVQSAPGAGTTVLVRLEAHAPRRLTASGFNAALPPTQDR
jgi:signal transduction histidine kinase/ligand-binding sensor domain-containing protein